ncbi:MAG: hypothetical protein EAZ92_02840 [Candidatus Kapaibacterium sp.]|nr:MAG: hypothetical protein EAZ92_02840 [Candidatus Kapabacteria bacterium]
MKMLAPYRTAHRFLLLCALTAVFLFTTLSTSRAQQRFPDDFWQEVQLSPPPDGVPDYWLEAYFMPSNPQLGWVVGFYRRSVLTTDGGKTWTRIQMPGRLSYDRSDERNHLEGVWFPDPQVGYSSGPGGVLKSTDSGRTWRDITPLQLAGVRTRLWGCYFTHRDTGIVLGGGCGVGTTAANPTRDAQYVFRTTDGGTTWSVFAGNEPNTGMTDAVIYSSRGLGYASSSGYIWRTQNGGITWNILASTQTPTSQQHKVWQEDLSISNNSFMVPLSGVQCSGGGINTGGVRFSRDGCTTWREHNSGTVMYGTFLLNDSTGWAVGDNATVIKTMDYGETWKTINCGIPTERNIDDLWFINDTLGFVVGEGIFRYIPPAKRELRISQNPPRNVYCQGDSVVLSVSDAFTEYLWSNGSSTATTTVRESGTYQVRVRVPTCVEGVDSVQVTFLPRPEARILFNGPSFFCEGATLRMTAASVQPDFRYHWSDGRTILSTSGVLNVSRSGNYTLRVRGPSGCEAASTQTITVLPRPNTQITALRNQKFCLGDSTILQAPAGFVEVRWARNTTQNQERNIARGQTLVTRLSGDYFAEMTDGNGCIWTSNTISVFALTMRKQLFITLEQPIFSMDSTGVGRITCATITLFNADTVRSVVMPNIPLFRNIEFSLPPSQLPFVLPPLTRKRLTVCFSPSSIGAVRDTLFVEDSCGVTPIALQAVAISNDYAGNSRCNARIILRSVGNSGGNAGTARALELVRLAQPAPNPASTSVSVLVERLLETANTAQNLEGQAISAKCVLKDILGNTLAEGEYAAMERFTDERTTQQYERGTFTLSTHHLI